MDEINTIRPAKANRNSFTRSLKNFFNWLWNSDSWVSFLVFLILIVIFIKLILLPGIGLIFRTQLPMAIVESSSMDHSSLEEIKGDYRLCGNIFSESKFFDLNNYWGVCGGWYEENTNITQEQFSDFKFKNGFRKGDIMIIFGKKNPSMGDVIVFNAGRNHPIIHRIISLNPIETKGDHNPSQLNEEKSINNNQIIGVAVARIPYVGLPKVWLCENFKVPLIC